VLAVAVEDVALGQGGEPVELQPVELQARRLDLVPVAALGEPERFVDRRERRAVDLTERELLLGLLERITRYARA
jgi:hypothetical protein